MTDDDRARTRQPALRRILLAAVLFGGLLFLVGWYASQMPVVGERVSQGETSTTMGETAAPRGEQVSGESPEGPTPPFAYMVDGLARRPIQPGTDIAAVAADQRICFEVGILYARRPWDVVDVEPGPDTEWVDRHYRNPVSGDPNDYICVNIVFGQVEGPVEVTLRKGYPLPDGSSLSEPLRYTIFLPSAVTYEVEGDGVIHVASAVATPGGLVDYWYVPTPIGDWFRQPPQVKEPFAAEVQFALHMEDGVDFATVRSWTQRSPEGSLKVMRVEGGGRSLTVTKAVREGLAELDLRRLMGPGGRPLAPPGRVWLHAPSTYDLFSWQPGVGTQELANIEVPGRPRWGGPGASHGEELLFTAGELPVPGERLETVWLLDAQNQPELVGGPWNVLGLRWLGDERQVVQTPESIIVVEAGSIEEFMASGDGYYGTREDGRIVGVDTVGGDTIGCVGHFYDMGGITTAGEGSPGVEEGPGYWVSAKPAADFIGVVDDGGSLIYPAGREVDGEIYYYFSRAVMDSGEEEQVGESFSEAHLVGPDWFAVRRGDRYELWNPVSDETVRVPSPVLNTWTVLAFDGHLLVVSRPTMDDDVQELGAWVAGSGGKVTSLGRGAFLGFREDSVLWVR